MSENRGRMKAVQKNNFVALMADMVMNRPAADMTSNEQKFMWLEITNFLNDLGPKKTMDQWKRCWTDIKSTVKEKVAGGDKKMTKIDMKVIAIMNKERQNGNIELRDVGLCSAPSSSSLASVTVASQQPVKGMLLSANKMKNLDVEPTRISDSLSSVPSWVRNPLQFFDNRGSHRRSVERTSSPHGEISSQPTKNNGHSRTNNIRKRALTIIGDVDSPRAKTAASINLNKPPSSTQTSRINRLSSVQSQVHNTQQCFDDRESLERTIVGRQYPHSEISSKLMEVYGLNRTKNIHNRVSTDIDTPRPKTIAPVNLKKVPPRTQTSATGSTRLQSQLQNRADIECDYPDPLSHSRKSATVVSRYDSRQVSTEYFGGDGEETQLPNCESGTGNGLSFLQSNYTATSSDAGRHRSTGTFSDDERYGSPISQRSDESWAGNISSGNSSDGEDSQYEETVNQIVRTRELARSSGRDPSIGSQYEETVNRIVRTRELESNAGRDPLIGSQYEETVNRIVRTREIDRNARSDPSIGSKNSGRVKSRQQVPVNNAYVHGQESRAVRRDPSDEHIDVYDSGRENGGNEEHTRGNGRGRGRGGSRGRARQQYQQRRPSQPLSTLADNSIKLQEEGTDILRELKLQNDVIIDQNKEIIRTSKEIALYNRGILSILRAQSEQA